MNENGETLIQITSKFFVAGLVLAGGEVHGQRVVSEAAPILRYMVGWPFGKVRSYCTTRGFKVTEYSPTLRDGAAELLGLNDPLYEDQNNVKDPA
jgi:hypothetical protein